MSIINWAKNHKLVVVLLLVIAYLYLNNNTIVPFSQFSKTSSIDYYPNSLPSTEMGMIAPGTSLPPQYIEKISDTTDRIVIQNSNMSLLVKDVRDSGNQIVTYAKNSGGFMVNTSYNRPSESPFATITVRVPTDNLDEALSFIRSLAIKVTSENLVGTDVTDTYIDIEARLATLKKTQARFEEILDKAVEVQDILTVTRELINLQQQIDSLIGQNKSIENNAKLTKITMYLSADELALPYAPDKAFRPELTFKLAVRSLLSTLRDGANMIIWIGVYSIILVPLLIIVFIVYKKYIKKQQKPFKEA